MVYVYLKSLLYRCGHTDLGGLPLWIITLGFVSNVLLTLNSSINLLIYCSVATDIRTKMFRMLCCTPEPNRNLKG